MTSRRGQPRGVGRRLPRRRALARAPFRRETRRRAPRGRAVPRRRLTPANSRCGQPRGVGRRLPRRRALARAPFRRGRRRRDFGNESAVNSIDASTARRDERLRRCHRPVCTWIMRVGARHRTWSASAPRLAGRRPTPLRAQDAAPPSYTLESAFGRARRHSATTEDGRRRRRGGFKLLVCVARPARRRMHHRLWLPHEA